MRTALLAAAEGVVLAALLAVAGCSPAARAHPTPLRDQAPVQMDADRTRCDTWAKLTADPHVGYAACMVAAGYEANPEVRATSQRVRLTRTPASDEAIRVLVDFMACDGDAQREVERNFGIVRRFIRDFTTWSVGIDRGRRRQLFVDCLRPRGYEIAPH
jgi:hypothetical protein